MICERLTDDGDALFGFARTILAAHDQALGYFRGSAMRGRLRFGSARLTILLSLD